MSSRRMVLTWLRRVFEVGAVLIPANALGFAFAHWARAAHAAGNPLLASTGADPNILSGYVAYVRDLIAGALVLPTTTRESLPTVLVGAAGLSATLLAAVFALSTSIGLVAAFAGARVGGRRSGWLWPLSALGQSLPSFLIASAFALALASLLGGRNVLAATVAGPDPARLVLAVIALAPLPTARIAYLASRLLASELGKPYVAAARSFGYAERAIVSRVAARNIAAIVIETLAASLRLLIAELVVVEWLLQLRGLGWFIAAALVPSGVGQGSGTNLFLHPPLTATLFIIVAAIFVVINAAAGALARHSDPRLRSAAGLEPAQAT